MPHIKGTVMQPIVGLTPQELTFVTGYARASNQRTALIEMGIEFKVRPDGTPFVARTTLDGTETQEDTANKLPKTIVKSI